MLAAAAQATAISRNGKTLTQANFISKKNPARDSISRESSAGPVGFEDVVPRDVPATVKKKKDDELDPEFLAALPPELRAEVIAEHKRKKLQAFRLSVNRKAKAPAPIQAPRPVQRIKVHRPPKPTFTTQKLSKEKDLRAAMREWVHEFADEGPYGEDVTALVKYLGKVVHEERDLAKAVGVAKWVDWVVSDIADDMDAFDAERWDQALEQIKLGVTAAAKARGLGVVSFE
jgi:DNA repair protein REV1